MAMRLPPNTGRENEIIQPGKPFWIAFPSFQITGPKVNSDRPHLSCQHASQKLLYTEYNLQKGPPGQTNQGEIREYE